MTTDGSKPFRILAISGSLRAASYNSGLIRAAVEVAPEGIEVDVLERLGEVPLLEVPAGPMTGFPPPVAAVVERLAAADAVLIATPEYCYGVPGGLKNLIDWLSFPPPTNPLRFKPVALMGASIGQFGTLRAQASLRQSLLFHDACVMSKPEVYVAAAPEKFDEAGELTDEATRALVGKAVAELRDFALAVRQRGLSHEREFIFT